MSEQPEATAEAETKTESKATETPAGEMTAEEKKFLMLALWESLIAPKWTKDTMIDFGKAIFSKKLFKDMTDKEFNQIFPFLHVVTVELGKKLVQKKEENEKAADATKETNGSAEVEK